MKTSWCIGLILCFGGSLYAFQQKTIIKNYDASLQAQITRNEGNKVHLQGAVIIRTDAIEIHAGEVEFDGDTGQLEARGNVSARPTPALYLNELLSMERSDLAEALSKLTEAHPAVVCTRRKIDALELRSKDTATWSIQADTLKLQLKRSTC
jgi:hypothetical protein